MTFFVVIQPNLLFFNIIFFFFWNIINKNNNQQKRDLYSEVFQKYSILPKKKKITMWLGNFLKMIFFFVVVTLTHLENRKPMQLIILQMRKKKNIFCNFFFSLKMKSIWVVLDGVELNILFFCESLSLMFTFRFFMSYSVNRLVKWIFFIFSIFDWFFWSKLEIFFNYKNVYWFLFFFFFLQY